MEFKFRAGNHRPPQPYASPRPPAVYCFSKQGFPDPCLRRNTNTMRKPFDINEAMHCELELMRLREEKLLVEIERQRFLKEEARRELMLAEREMAIRRAAQAAGYSFREQRWGTSFNAEAPAPAPVVHSFHEWQRMEQLKSYDRRCFEASPLPRPHPQQFLAGDRKRQVQADKSELILLEKPNPKLFSEKRKVETPSTSVNDIQPSGVKKNPKEEWSCALCQVAATNERTFNQHLQGKKHKRKEAGLRAQNASNVSQAAPGTLPKNKRKLHEVTGTVGSAGAEKELKVEEPLQCEKTGVILNLNTMSPNFLNLGGKEDKQQHGVAVIYQNMKSEAMFVGKKKFNFWCKMCEVGAYAEEVMADHLKGRKHNAKLQQVGQSGTGQPL